VRHDYPNGLQEIKDYYGDPNPYLRHDGTIHPSWERFTLDYVYLPEPLPLGWDRSIVVHRVRVHVKLTAILDAIFNEIMRENLWGKLVTFDGSYAWRPSRGSQKLSTHSWGIALDLNAGTNPLGSEGDMDPRIVDVFENKGWEWGGRWSRPDPMHFQAAHGY
jgi:hypothetical protein